MAVYPITPESDNDLAAFVSVKGQRNSFTAPRVFPFVAMPQTAGTQMPYRQPADKVTYATDRAAGTALGVTYNNTGKATWECNLHEGRAAVSQADEQNYCFGLAGDDAVAAIDAVNVDALVETGYAIAEQLALKACATALGGTLDGNKLVKGTVVAQFLATRDKIRKIYDEAVAWMDTDTFDRLALIPELQTYFWRFAEVTSVESYLTMPQQRQEEALAKVLGVNEVVVYGSDYRPAEIPAGTVLLIGRARGTAGVNAAGTGSVLVKRALVPLCMTYVPFQKEDPSVFARFIRHFDPTLKDNILDAEFRLGKMLLCASDGAHTGIEYLTVDQTPGAYDPAPAAVTSAGEI